MFASCPYINKKTAPCQEILKFCTTPNNKRKSTLFLTSLTNSKGITKQVPFGDVKGDHRAIKDVQCETTNLVKTSEQMSWVKYKQGLLYWDREGSQFSSEPLDYRERLAIWNNVVSFNLRVQISKCISWFPWCLNYYSRGLGEVWQLIRLHILVNVNVWRWGGRGAAEVW